MASEKSKILLQRHCNCHTHVGFITYNPMQKNKRDNIAMLTYLSKEKEKRYITEISYTKNTVKAWLGEHAGNSIRAIDTCWKWSNIQD